MTKYHLSPVVLAGAIGSGGAVVALLIVRRRVSKKRKLPTLSASVSRPELVEDAMKHNKPLYYFGFASNMLRSKVVGRSLDSSPIEIISMQPAHVPGYHLAFSLRGFPPLEPAMAALEHCDSSDTTTPWTECLFNKKEGCHGALIQVTAKNYDKIWRSEGGGHANSGYKEVVVTAYPYDNKEPVQAVALFATDRVRLKHEICPSPRYMAIVCKGAEEAGLKAEYRECLDRYPVQKVPPWLRTIAVNNMFLMIRLGTVFKTRFFLRVQSWFLWTVFVPSTSSCWIKRNASNVACGLILFPGSLLGSIVRLRMYLFGIKMPSCLLCSLL